MSRILLLDKAHIIDRLKKLLADLGHEVTAADTDAYAALALIKSASPDLMMISMNLPGGGAQLIDRMRAEAPTAKTPIIALFDDNWAGVRQDSITRLLQNTADSVTMKLLLDELLPRKAPPQRSAPPELEAESGDFAARPSKAPSTAAMDMGAPSDDDLPPGETIEL